MAGKGKPKKRVSKDEQAARLTAAATEIVRTLESAGMEHLMTLWKRQRDRLALEVTMGAPGDGRDIESFRHMQGAIHGMDEWPRLLHSIRAALERGAFPEVLAGIGQEEDDG